MSKVGLASFTGLIAGMVACIWVGRQWGLSSYPNGSPTQAPRRTNLILPDSNANSVKVVPKLDWSGVESADYREYIKNLGAIGCPRETVVDIIVADVNKLFARRAQEYQASHREPFKFWMSNSQQRKYAQWLPTEKAHFAQLDVERRRLITALLGADATEEKLGPFPVVAGSASDARIGFLSPEKQAMVRQIEFDADRESRMKFPSGELGRDQVREMKRMALETDLKIADVLSKEEKLEFDLRNSPTAQRMRADLEGMDMSEHEFKKVHALRKVFDDRFGPMAPDTEINSAEARVAAFKELAAGLATTLGEKRFDEYQRAMDSDFRRLREFSNSNSISQEKVEALYELKKVMASKANAIWADFQLSPEAKDGMISALQLEAKNGAEALLPAEKRKAFMSDRSSNWIQKLRDPARFTDLIDPKSVYGYFTK